eukprot:scaffold598646_cov17-Prasinocladus_malaysianus.AAC.1
MNIYSYRTSATAVLVLVEVMAVVKAVPYRTVRVRGRSDGARQSGSENYRHHISPVAAARTAN